MSNNTNRPQRRCVRLPGYDYAGPGTIFVTICTLNCRMLFGEIIDGHMRKSDIGEIATELWRDTFTMRSELTDHGSIIMPNHMHALFTMDPEGWDGSETSAYAHRVSKSVGQIVGGYKSAVTSRVRESRGDPEFTIWQRGFHEVIVRTEARFNAIVQYIVENPARWAEDRYRDEML